MGSCILYAILCSVKITFAHNVPIAQATERQWVNDEYDCVIIDLCEK